MELNRTVELPIDGALDHAAPEAPARRHADRRPARLGPVHGKMPVGVPGPLDGHAPARRRQGAVLRRVRRELMEGHRRSEEHTAELQSLMRISYAVFCLKKKK